MNKTSFKSSWHTALSMLLFASIAGNAIALCPGSTPQYASEINSQPEILSLCSTAPGGGCKKSPTPTVGGIRAQEAVLHATVPVGFVATSAQWMAYWVNDSGTHDLLWNYTSRDGRPWTEGEDVKFGAVGLPESSDVRFRMSLCDDVQCFCWSDFSAIYSTTTFSGTAPEPIDTDAQEIEEIFERPETTYYTNNGEGDGVGPDEVWYSYKAKIADDLDPITEGGVVYLAPTSIMRRIDELEHEHAYAEAWVRNDLAWVNSEVDWVAEEYNIDVAVRSLNAGLTSYYVKLVHESGYGTIGNVPALVIGRLAAGNRDELLPGGILLLDNPDRLDQPGCPKVGDDYPLENEDTTLSGRSKPALMRIEVNDTVNDATVTAYLAWDCSSGSIEDCASVCKVGPVTDVLADGLGLHKKTGATSVSGHHTSHYVDSFKAGSTPN